MSVRYSLAFVALCVAGSGVSGAHASCGSAYCLVNTQWSNQGLLAAEGSQLDLRYEYIHQDQLTSTDSKAKPQGIDDEHDERSTTNRNLQLTYSYASHDGWGVSVNAPLVSRDHSHVHNEPGNPELERWSYDHELGDVRVLGRQQLTSLTDHTTVCGIIAGVKLPTGQYDQRNHAGEKAERTLQPGTGTTDALLGAYCNHALADGRSSVYAQALGQSALNHRDQFKPGGRAGLDVGYHYAATERLGLQLQANYVKQWRDEGAQAEPADSGLQAVYLSPGVMFALTPAVQVYGFVQLPVYQYVNGTQLTADSALTAGISMGF